MVSKMASGEKRVPLDRCPYIQQFTGHAVTCEELRPDQIAYFRLVRAQAGARAARQRAGGRPVLAGGAA